MAKKKKSTILLIMPKPIIGEQMASELRSLGYTVFYYMTARECLFDCKVSKDASVVCESRLMGMSGIELWERFQAEHPSIPFILVGGHKDIPPIAKAAPTDFLTKPLTAEAVDRAVSRQVDHEEFDEAELRKAFDRLTPREREVLDLVVGGASSREIGIKLEVSSKTIEAHRSRIRDKTRATDIGELTLMWRAWQAINQST
jgi:RNA polymerase sigma factor (sigma-70 family)